MSPRTFGVRELAHAFPVVAHDGGRVRGGARNTKRRQAVALQRGVESRLSRGRPLAIPRYYRGKDVPRSPLRNPPRPRRLVFVNETRRAKELLETIRGRFFDGLAKPRLFENPVVTLRKSPNEPTPLQNRTQWDSVRAVDASSVSPDESFCSFGHPTP